MPPAAAGTSASLHVWQEPAVPPHTPLPFCDTIQFAIETDRSCHRQRPGAEWRSGLFSLPPICAPVPADLNLPGSKKAPGGVSSFGLYHRLPQDSPSRIRAAERHTKALPYSLFTRPTPAFPSRFPGSPENRSPQGAEDQFPGGNAGLQNALSPRTAPHAGHRLILNPCRRAALRNSSLFSILYSLSQPCSFFPPGRTAKQKYILFFGHLTHNSTRYNIGLNLIMEGKEYGKTGSA